MNDPNKVTRMERQCLCVIWTWSHIYNCPGVRLVTLPEMSLSLFVDVTICHVHASKEQFLKLFGADWDVCAVALALLHLWVIGSFGGAKVCLECKGGWSR